MKNAVGARHDVIVCVRNVAFVRIQAGNVSSWIRGHLEVLRRAS